MDHRCKQVRVEEGHERLKRKAETSMGAGEDKETGRLDVSLYLRRAELLTSGNCSPYRTQSIISISLNVGIKVVKTLTPRWQRVS